LKCKIVKKNQFSKMTKTNKNKDQNWHKNKNNIVIKWW
jgi:hypothetical protein